MRVADLSETPIATAPIIKPRSLHRHRYHPYHNSKTESVAVLRSISRNQQDEPSHKEQLQQSKLLLAQRRIHNHRHAKARQRQQQEQLHQRLHQHQVSLLQTFSSFVEPEERQEAPTSPPASPSTVPSLQSTPSSTPVSSPVRPQKQQRRQVQFDEQLSYLPTGSIVLTPELIDELWFSRQELDECKLQVRTDFWAFVKASRKQNASSDDGDEQQRNIKTLNDVCWVGMERYWDAVHISSTQRGLKQAILQAQVHLQQQQAYFIDYQGSCDIPIVLADISQHWTRSCQERAWWYASMVTEQVYGDEGNASQEMQNHQQLHQQMIVDASHQHNPDAHVDYCSSDLNGHGTCY